MRIVIDLHGAQKTSPDAASPAWDAYLAFAQAIVRNRGAHQVLLAADGAHVQTIDPIRNAFAGLLAPEHIRFWHGPEAGPSQPPSGPAGRRHAGLIRAAFLASLWPDIIHLCGELDSADEGELPAALGHFQGPAASVISLHAAVPAAPDQPAQSAGPAEPATPAQQRHCHAIATLRQSPAHLVELAELVELPPLPVAGEGEPVSGPSPWDSAAIRAWGQWQAHASQREHPSVLPVQASESEPPVAFSRPTVGQRLRLAYVSPLPPERTGIADYSAELLPELARHYDIELIVEQDQIDPQFLRDNPGLRPRDAAWLRANAHRVDRVLYHIGNSPWHRHMPALLRDIHGTVVLHDFYLGHLYAWLEDARQQPYWIQALHESHGYLAVRERLRGPEAAKRSYPANLPILRHALGVIVHSNHSRTLAAQWYGPQLPARWQQIPHLRTPVPLTGPADRNTAREQLGIAEDEFVIASFGFLGPAKQNHRLLHAFLHSTLARNPKARLCFVGELPLSDYGADMQRAIQASGARRRIHITGYAAAHTFRQYLAAADLAVQLRTDSRGETSGTILDAMSRALPLITNANGAIAELDPGTVWMLPDDFSDQQLITALQTLHGSPARRQALGERARQAILTLHNPADCARRYAQAIETFHQRPASPVSRLIRAIAEPAAQPPASDAELAQLARAIDASLPAPGTPPRLLLDITATCRNDLKTGIERVARAILLALLESPPSGHRVEPVYLSDEGGQWHYRHASHYTLGLLGAAPAQHALPDEIAEPASADILLTLDISGQALIQASQAGLLARWRRHGAAVHCIVYDLLPIRLPEVFPPGADAAHAQWLRAVTQIADGALCISQAVAHDLRDWMAQTRPPRPSRQPALLINWFHLGADVGNSAPTLGLPADASAVLARLRAAPSFVMVGTIEPRKACAQAIDAFNLLWEQGQDINLVIVGHEGWRGLPDAQRRDIPATVAQLRGHSRRGQRIFWLEGISDEYLEQIYAASTCLIAASKGEGFGLPLIEAAQHGLPLLLRDLPVFREVAGGHASYFQGHDPQDLADAVQHWLRQHASGHAPASRQLPWHTWQASARQLLQALGLPAPDEPVNQPDETAR